MSKETSQPFAPRRGRPTSKQAAAIERAIMDAARAQFMEFGYDAAAMEVVAGKLGISKGTLYARYPSKEALLSAVVKDSVSRWSAEAAVHDHELTPDILQRLQHHGRIIAASLDNQEVQAFQRLLLANGNRFPEIGAEMYEHGTLYIVSLIARDIVEAGDRDGIIPTRPVEVATSMVAAITGWHMQQSSFRTVSRQETEAFAVAFVDTIWRGRDAW